MKVTFRFINLGEENFWEVTTVYLNGASSTKKVNTAQHLRAIAKVLELSNNACIDYGH